LAFDELKSSGRGYHKKFIAPLIRLGKRLGRGFQGLFSGIKELFGRLKALWPRIISSLSNFGRAYTESMTASETAARRLRREKQRSDKDDGSNDDGAAKQKHVTNNKPSDN
jgi:hypothetical protein